MHWSFDDPAAAEGNDELRLAVFARYVMKYFSGYDCLLTQRRLVAIYAKRDLSTSPTTKYSVRRLKEVSKLLFF
jgi:hypothetical protein